MSTFIPGAIPFLTKKSGKEIPLLILSFIVSSNIITPLINSSMPGVVKRSSRYSRLKSSVDEIPIDKNLFSIVGNDSSAASIPFPGATSALAIFSKSISILKIINQQKQKQDQPILLLKPFLSKQKVQEKLLQSKFQFLPLEKQEIN